MSTEGESVTREGLASELFRGFFQARREKYARLRENLLKARIFVPVERWLSRAVFYSLIAAASAAALYLILKFLILSQVAEFSLDTTELILTSLVAVGTFGASYTSFSAFPRIRAWERKGAIDRNLPYAIGYISAMASIGVYPFAIFKKLAKAEETYGEVSKEVQLLVRDVEFLGFDFITALKKLVATTPSIHMRAFLQGAVTTALSGGEMGSYFVRTAGEYMEERRKKYGDFIELLSLFAEFYVIGLVASPLLLVVVLSIMTFMGGASLAGLAAIIYLIIPLGSAAFIFLIGSLSE